MKLCNKCGSDSHIYESRIKDDGTVVRRRECNNCGHKWMTIEVEYWKYQQMLKNTGDHDAEFL